MKRKLQMYAGLLLCIAFMFSGCSHKEEISPDKRAPEISTEQTVQEIAPTAAESKQEESLTESTPEESLAETTPEEPAPAPAPAVGVTVEKDGTYTSKDEVAAYIHTFGCLPSNFISKYDAQDLGWDNKAGNLWDVAPGKSIGGDKFGNYEGLLPTKSGRKYYECDIDYDGSYRNGKRIVFSNDGLIYYTEDHYESFTLLYGEE